MTNEKELTTVEKTEMTEYDDSVLGACNDITTHDLQIGRIGIMQPGSILVKEEKARQGAVIDTETEEELAYKTETPLEFLIVKSQKYWVEYKNDEFFQRLPAIHQNEKPWSEGEIDRMFTHSFYILLKRDVEAGMVMPYELSFRSTELKTAKRISKILFMMGQQRKPSWSKVFKLTTDLKTKGKHSWFASKVDIGEDANDDMKKAAYTLYQQMNNASTVSHAGENATEEDCDY
jgi:hypothetical protein